MVPPAQFVCGIGHAYILLERTTLKRCGKQSSMTSLLHLMHNCQQKLQMRIQTWRRAVMVGFAAIQFYTALRASLNCPLLDIAGVQGPAWMERWSSDCWQAAINTSPLDNFNVHFMEKSSTWYNDAAGLLSAEARL